MNLDIKTFFFSILIIFSIEAYGNDSFEHILRESIIKNGFLSPEEIYFNPNEELADLGEVLFKSKNISLNGKVSCSTCHLDSEGSSDGIPNAAGIRGEGEGKERLLSGASIVPRNTLGFWGVGSKGFKTLFWDGRVDFSNYKVISQFGHNPPSKDPLVTAIHLPVVEIREVLDEDSFILSHKEEKIEGAMLVYKAIVQNLIKTENDTMKKLASKRNKKIEDLTFMDISLSIASFIRKEFKIQNTPLNEFVKGKKTLDNEQIKGGILFYGKGNCSSCHNGPLFSDLKFYTIPFPQLGFGKNGFGIDYGRYNTTFNPSDLYKFRTPILYNNGKTSPYGHSGSVSSLEEAIKAHSDPLAITNIQQYSSLQRHEYYKYIVKSDAIDRVNYLTDDEIKQIVKFLESLNFN